MFHHTGFQKAFRQRLKIPPASIDAVYPVKDTADFLLHAVIQPFYVPAASGQETQRCGAAASRLREKGWYQKLYSL